MTTLRRLIYRDVVTAVAFVTLAFLALFFFFNLLDERGIGQIPGYTIGYAMLKVGLGLPGYLYELLPISVLIGTIFVMARMAQSSEFTIMRTSGLGPWQALRTLLALGLAFVVLTVTVGDYMAPASERLARRMEASFLGTTQSIGHTGAWLKERNPLNQNTLAVNVGAISADGQLQRIRIFEFDLQGRAVLQLHASSGQVDATAAPAQWQLEQVVRNHFLYDADPQGQKQVLVQRATFDKLAWPTNITHEMLMAAVYRPDQMTTLELFQFIQHLRANQQSTQKYEISFWRKVFYPLSCVVMIVLALPFAYLHFRTGGIAGYVFGGVMAGISFFLLNNVFGYAGNLQHWSPMLTAAAPGLIYSLLSLAALGWLVLRR